MVLMIWQLTYVKDVFRKKIKQKPKSYNKNQNGYVDKSFGRVNTEST